MDSASLALAGAVLDSVRPAILLLSTRPIPEGRQPLLEALARRNGVERLPLGPLSSGDCVALAAQHLCVRAITGSIADLIAAKSQGNPFFAIEIAFALREGALVMIDGDECKPVAGIGEAVGRFAQKNGYTLVRNLASHGIGRSLHEEPKEIATWPERSERRVMQKGLVFTVEPFLSLGADWAEHAEGDRWTLYSEPRAPTVQYEHTVVATANGPLVLTLPG